MNAYLNAALVTAIPVSLILVIRFALIARFLDTKAKVSYIVKSSILLIVTIAFGFLAAAFREKLVFPFAWQITISIVGVSCAFFAFRKSEGNTAESDKPARGAANVNHY